MAESTYETLKNRGRNIDAAVDSAVNGNPTVSAPQKPTGAPISQPKGSTSADNKLPEDQGIFHRIKRGLGME